MNRVIRNLPCNVHYIFDGSQSALVETITVVKGLESSAVFHAVASPFLTIGLANSLRAKIILPTNITNGYKQTFAVNKYRVRLEPKL